MTAKLLLVDDEEELLDILGEFLEEQGYRVVRAPSGETALGILEKEPFDLIISDINMPGMKGFELLEKVAHDFPNTRRVLITAYDVRDYLLLAKKHNIGNIIAKTTPFNFDEIRILVRNILTEDVFGLERYIDGTISKRTISHSNEIESVLQSVVDSMSDIEYKRRFKHGLGELIINAVYYGAKDESGDRKHEWQLEVPLATDETLLVSWGVDTEKAGAAVTDQKGRLTKSTILYWLERNTSPGPDGHPLGFYDKHGKGLFITRAINDRVIVNIKHAVQTEVIILNYREGLYDGHRPLWIHEF